MRNAEDGNSFFSAKGLKAWAREDPNVLSWLTGEPEKSKEDGHDSLDSDDDILLEGHFPERSDEHAKYTDPDYHEESADPFENNSAGDEFPAVKPFLGNIKDPSNVSELDHDGDLPSQHLQLEHVHGYSASGPCRNNVFYDIDGEGNRRAVFFAAGVGIVQEVQGRKGVGREAGARISPH